MNFYFCSLLQVMHGTLFAETMVKALREWWLSGHCPTSGNINETLANPSCSSRPLLTLLACGFATVVLIAHGSVALIGGKRYALHYRWINLFSLAVCGASRMALIVLERQAQANDRTSVSLAGAIFQNLLAIGFSLGSHEVNLTYGA